MKASEYRINSKESADAFERKLRDYCAVRRIYMDPFSMSEAYIILTMPGFDPRCFGAYLDLCLQDVALQLDINILCERSSKLNKTINADGFSDERMDRYIASSNAAHRIRAMWDKIMGLIILLEHPTSYEEFINGRQGRKARSRLGAFRRINEQYIKVYKDESEELVSFLTSNLERIANNVTMISDNFRTGEAHSVGRLLKWAFAKQVDEDDPFEIMIESYNEVRVHMNRLISSIYLKAAYAIALPIESHQTTTEG